MTLRGSPKRRALTPAIAPAIAFALFFTPVARADDRSDGQPSDAAAAEADTAARRRLFEILLGDDWKLSQIAERELSQAGAVSARMALQLRREQRSARSRDRLDKIARAVVEALVVEMGRPLDTGRERGGTFAAFGDMGGIASKAYQRAADKSALGSDVVPNDVPRAEIEAAGAVGRDDPRSVAEGRQRARAARAALAWLGPGATGLALDVPPLREFVLARTLDLIALAVYQGLAQRIEKDPRTEAEVAAELKGLADLAAPLIRAGLADTRENVRRAFQRIRDAAVELEVAGLDQTDPDRREACEAALFRLSDLARLTLDRLGKTEDRPAQVRLSAARLARRIRYRLSDALVRKLGHEFEGYEAKPFHERRSICLELERLGGQDAIPALRALLQEDPSNEIREVVALGLFRQQDWVGAEWLRLHGMVASPRISKEEVARIHMEQGLKYLTLNNYSKAEAEFKKVLELQAKNEVGLYNLACTYSRWGKLEEALDFLKRAIEAGFDDATHMEKDSDLDNIREDPRYREMIDAIKKKKSEAPKSPAPGGDGE